ncbi:PLP-dependent transferase, partial [Rhizobium ruizarguesonis]
LSQGDDLVVHKTLYANTVAMVEQGLPRFVIKVVSVDLSDPRNLDAAITEKTRLVYFETPVNPLSAILDPGSDLVMENPGYRMARQIFTSTGAS